MGAKGDTLGAVYKERDPGDLLYLVDCEGGFFSTMSNIGTSADVEICFYWFRDAIRRIEHQVRETCAVVSELKQPPRKTGPLGMGPYGCTSGRCTREVHSNSVQIVLSIGGM